MSGIKPDNIDVDNNLTPLTRDKVIETSKMLNACYN